MPAGEIIIADSSPLIGLAKVDRLELLRQLAMRVIVPPAVWAEVTSGRIAAPGADQVATSSWIEIVKPKPAPDAALLAEVDRGEAEAISLARQLTGAVLLMDDLRGRRVAARFQLRIVGTVGLLIRAKHSGLVPALRPIFDELVSNGIYLSPALIEAALVESGEV